MLDDVLDVSGPAERTGKHRGTDLLDGTGAAWSAKATGPSATVETTAQTGVEMEALTAASVAALTVYDMAKAIDKAMVIAEITLVEKTKAEA